MMRNTWSCARLALVAIVVAQGSLALAQGVGPATPTPPERPSNVVPLNFNGAGELVFGADPSFQLQTGTIELYFMPAWSAKDNVGAQEGNRCLLACAENSKQTRYAVYITGDLDGIGFWNGASWLEFPARFERGVWYHLALIVSRERVGAFVDGVPMGVREGGIRAGASDRWPLILGSSGGKHDMFFGSLANVRLWTAPLSVPELQVMSTFSGPPAEPELASCLSAYSSFTTTGRGMVPMDPNTPTRSADILEAKLKKGFVTGVDWKTTPAEAMREAGGSAKLILAYATQVDARNLECSIFENSIMGSAWWMQLATECVPLLLRATTATPAPLGVPAGSCALLNDRGEVLSLFQPWSEAFVRNVVSNAKKAEEARRNLSTPLSASGAAPGNSQEERLALVALQAVELRPTDEDALGQLRRSATHSDVSAETKLRIDQATKVAKIYHLQEAFVGGRDFTGADGKTIAFASAKKAYAQNAMALFATLPLPLAPSRRLTTYTYLMWDGAIDYPVDFIVQSAVDFAARQSSMDPFVDAYVHSKTPNVLLNAAPEAAKGP